MHRFASKQGATIIMDENTDGKASSRYVQVIKAVLALALSLLDSGPSADTCFDVLALSLLLSRYLSVNVHAKRLPLIPTQRLLVTWYLRSL